MNAGNVRVVIQVAGKDSAKAWGLLVRHSPGIAFPGGKFIVSEEAVRALSKAGVTFTQLSINESAHEILDRKEG